jgi:hypothetical protein
MPPDRGTVEYDATAVYLIDCITGKSEIKNFVDEKS